MATLILVHVSDQKKKKKTFRLRKAASIHSAV